MTARRKLKAPPPERDFEETREHIFLATRELLLAARGALRFFKGYAENAIPPSRQPAVISFFEKAIGVADILGRGLPDVPAVRGLTDVMARHVVRAMGSEMNASPKKARQRSRRKRTS